MTSAYDILLAYAREHKSDPIGLAKTLTAWQWAALLPGSDDGRPSRVEDVPQLLSATCGWRDLLMSALFSAIGIQSRRVNFYNVPFQGGHTTTELFINGKWMWFDPTFGTYFQSINGGAPLSIAEARAQWPNVTVQHSTLIGWQGKFLDLSSVEGSIFASQTEPFCLTPTAYYGADFVVSGELNSLYFGPSAAYYSAGNNVYIGSGSHSFIVADDVAASHVWSHYEATYTNNRIDVEWGRYDTQNFWFTDFDQDNYSNWARQTTYIDADSRIDYKYTIYDDDSKLVEDTDQLNEYYWIERNTSYDVTGALDTQTGIYDDGRSWFIDWDNQGIKDWKYYDDEFDVSGGIVTTIFVNDDGTTQAIDWTTLLQQGSSTNDVLVAAGEGRLLVGLAGNDSLYGSVGMDKLFGGDGDDILDGKGGPDRLEGGAGNDTYIVSDAGDVVVEAAASGSDTVLSSIDFRLPANVEHLSLLPGANRGTGNELANGINGTEASDRLDGLDGNDSLNGLGGNDVLVGGAGNDTLNGGRGVDVLYGNAGCDTFVWSSIADTGVTSSTADLITDFQPTSGDRIALSAIDANIMLSGKQSFTFVGAHALSAPGQVSSLFIGGENRIFLNVDGNPAADAVIRVAGNTHLDASAFIM